MRVAARDKRIEIVRDRQVGRDVYNAPMLESDVLAVVWAQKRSTPGREFLSGAAPVSEELATFTIRWRGDLLTTDRVRCEGRIFDIQGLREIGRRRDLEILAKAVG